MRKFETHDEFENFDFQDAVIGDIEVLSNSLRFCLDNVKIKPENSKNRDIRLMRANDLYLSFRDVTVESFVREGLRYYDANGKLLRTEDDEVLDLVSFPNLRDFIAEAVIFSIYKKGNNYEICFDAKDEFPYDLKFTASSNIQEWDRFINL